MVTGLLALSACANPFQASPAPTVALLPTLTPAPYRPTVRPTATVEQEQSASRARLSPTRYSLCSEQSPLRTARPPAPIQADGRIAYLTRDGNLALTDSSGRERAEITSDAYILPSSHAARIYQFPAFSPDGDWIAFVAVEINGFNGVSQTVYAAPAQDRPPLNVLYQTDAFNIPYLDWSPDGQTVAFLTINPFKGAIRLAERDGNRLRTVQEGAPTYWHWRSDARALLTHIGGSRDTNADAIIAITSTYGSAPSVVLAEAPGNFQSPHFSPDSQHMLYVVSGDTTDELVLADSAGKPICSVAALVRGAFFAWSPDGARIAFMDTQSPTNDPAPLFVVDLERGQRERVHPAAMMFFWSPNGERIAIYAMVREGIPDRFTTPGSAPRLGAPVSRSAQPVLRIEVLDLRTGKLYRVTDTVPSRQFAQYFQFFDQYSRAVTPWSPDGTRLVFASLRPEEGASDIVVATFNAAADRYESRRIASGVLAFWSPR
ncbi:MAG: hypothetical protein ACK4WM_03385 [Thermoflexales bacterium]